MKQRIVEKGKNDLRYKCVSNKALQRKNSAIRRCFSKTTKGTVESDWRGKTVPEVVDEDLPKSRHFNKRLWKRGEGGEEHLKHLADSDRLSVLLFLFFTPPGGRSAKPSAAQDLLFTFSCGGRVFKGVGCLPPAIKSLKKYQNPLDRFYPI